MTWPRVFNSRYPSPLGCALGMSLLAGAGGLALLHVHVLTWLAVLLLLYAVGATPLTCLTETRVTISCTPAGFTVVTRRRCWRTRRAAYTWTDVVATRYREYDRWGGVGMGYVTGYFTPVTARGPAFTVDSYMPHFDELIATFNALTPHLPYTWEEGAVEVEPPLRQLGFGRYGKVPRARAEAKADEAR